MRDSKAALNHTVISAWEEYDGDRMAAVFEKLKDVAEAVIADDGGNSGVEKIRNVARKRLKEDEGLEDAESVACCKE